MGDYRCHARLWLVAFRYHVATSHDAVKRDDIGSAYRLDFGNAPETLGKPEVKIDILGCASRRGPVDAHEKDILHSRIDREQIYQISDQQHDPYRRAV